MTPFNTYIKLRDGDNDLYLLRVSRVSSMLSQNNKQQHVVSLGETLQSIAFKYYGDSGYWGDIAEFNGIMDPFSISDSMDNPDKKEIYPKMVLQIP
jgi:nucleoid-associated protein YgaU